MFFLVGKMKEVIMGMGNGVDIYDDSGIGIWMLDDDFIVDKFIFLLLLSENLGLGCEVF